MGYEYISDATNLKVEILAAKMMSLVKVPSVENDTLAS